jgi:hypothetical protein
MKARSGSVSANVGNWRATGARESAEVMAGLRLGSCGFCLRNRRLKVRILPGVLSHQHST